MAGVESGIQNPHRDPRAGDAGEFLRRGVKLPETIRTHHRHRGVVIDRHRRHRFHRQDKIGGQDIRQRRRRHVRDVGAQVRVVRARDHPKLGQRPAPLAGGVRSHQRDEYRHRLACGAGQHVLHERLLRLESGRHRADAQHAGNRGDSLEPARIGRDANARVFAGDSDDPRAERTQPNVQGGQVRARGYAEHGEREVAPGSRRPVEQRAGGRRGIEPLGIGDRRRPGANRARCALHAAAIFAERITFGQAAHAGIGFSRHRRWLDRPAGIPCRRPDRRRLHGRHLDAGPAFLERAPHGAFQSRVLRCGLPTRFV